MKTRKQDTYYFPQLFRGLIETRLDAYAEAVSYADGKIKAKVFSYKEVVGFEIYDIKRPYGTRMQLIHQRESENEYQITLPDDYDDNKKRFVVVFEDYSEIGVQDFRKVFIKED